MKLYDLERSGNCYKARLLLALLEVPYERIPMALETGVQRSESYLRLNPRGQIPVLEVDGVGIWDSTAILVYIARRFGGDLWFPSEPLAMARVTQWLALEQNEGRYGVARARAIGLKMTSEFARTGNLEEAQRFARVALSTLEGRLTDHLWLAGDHPTIADIACYPYTALSPDGGIELDPYPAIRGWFKRIEALPRYIPLPKRPVVNAK